RMRVIFTSPVRIGFWDCLKECYYRNPLYCAFLLFSFADDGLVCTRVLMPAGLIKGVDGGFIIQPGMYQLESASGRFILIA
ncbi:MAG: hypothetical protein VYA08_01715, partial [Pseudomonadota bacterium]|nr:hypothetical protein [Pseudomonadota bacterium]